MTRCGPAGRWWTDVGPNWEYDCNINPAPLAWAVTEALNTRSLAPFDVVYNGPLPVPFTEFIADLVEAEEATPVPAPKLTPGILLAPGPIAESPLPTPAP